MIANPEPGVINELPNLAPDNSRAARILENLGLNYLFDLGKGGECMAFAAYHPTKFDGKPVAIRVLNDETDYSRYSKRLRKGLEFQRQVFSLGAYVPEPLDSLSEKSRGDPSDYYEIQELIGDGINVGDLIRKHGKIPARVALRIILRAAESANCFGGSDIVHGDLKPENLFLSGTQTYVGDFGISRKIDESQTSARGSLAYMDSVYLRESFRSSNPEQRWVDPRGLCVTLYELVTGVRPFSVSSVDMVSETLMVAALSKPIKKIDEVTEIDSDEEEVVADIQTLLERELSADKNKRHENIHHLTHNLGALWMSHIVPHAGDVQREQVRLLREVEAQDRKIVLSRRGR